MTLRGIAVSGQPPRRARGRRRPGGCGGGFSRPTGRSPAAGPAASAFRFATDWRAQAEHGGFYQALATGEYAKRGLDVKIIQGGPA